MYDNDNNWHVAAGDPTHVFVGVAKPINCHSIERAKLIAAAPDLLDALRSATALFSRGEYPALQAKVNAAIDKAIS